MLPLSRLGVKEGCGHLLDEHVSELRELAVFAVLHLNEAPLGLPPQQLLPSDCNLPVTAYHRKWNVLLQRERERERCSLTQLHTENISKE